MFYNVVLILRVGYNGIYMGDVCFDIKFIDLLFSCYFI